MYGQESIFDPFFIALYSGAALLALVAALYLLLRRGNAFEPALSSSRRLRRWTAAFLLTVTLSHVWWWLLGTVWLSDDRLVRNILAIMLDQVTLVPLVACVLLAMLQDRRRPVWPWWVAEVPVVVLGAVGMAGRDWHVGYTLASCWQMALIVAFVIYYSFAVRHYGRWLLDNFADLDHKEVWQSLVFALALFAAYWLYTSNGGSMLREYLSQVLTLVITGFLVWRTETLQELREEWGGKSEEVRGTRKTDIKLTHQTREEQQDADKIQEEC